MKPGKLIITITVLFIILINLFPVRAAEPNGVIEPEMVLIKGGTYEMGESSNRKTVTVNDFYIGKYEVTNAEYCQYAPNHKGSWSNSDYPVETVTWDDAVNYCEWLSKKTGKNYRLPTNAEWEYACRAGSTTDYYWGENMNEETYNRPSIDEYVWYRDNSDMQVHPVGQKKPNNCGLYDMVGNVWEWCSDWYDSSNQEHIYRGGGWGNYASDCWSSYRGHAVSANYSCVLGFRIVMKPWLSKYTQWGL
jgi:formylglycine-generating enzyme required for sulfatase activity